MRIYELAKELKMNSKDLVSIIEKELGVEIKNHMSSITDLETLRVKKALNVLNNEKKSKKETMSDEELLIDESIDLNGAKIKKVDKKLITPVKNLSTIDLNIDNPVATVNPANPVTTASTNRPAGSNNTNRQNNTNRPNNTSKPYNTNNTSQSVSSNNTSRPNNTSQPASTNNTSRPSNTSRPVSTNNTSRPANTSNTSRPAGTNNTSRPAGTNNTSRPAGTSNTSRPANTSNTSRPAGTSNTSRPANTSNTNRSNSTNKPNSVNKPSSGGNSGNNRNNNNNNNNRNRNFNNKKGSTNQTNVEQEKKVQQVRIKNVEIEEPIIVRELADRMNVPVNNIISKLITLGVMATLNQEIDFDVAYLIAEECQVKLIKKEFIDELKILEESISKDEEDEEKDLVERSPIVTVMGHVDHGKTSLLDAIRDTSVTKAEAGGITQHIGASQVEIKGKKITFLDTPGHEAFTSMRARGAKITDIAILVVAADDGVMPQTIEAINHAKAASVPIIVAVNKIDKEGVDIDRVKQELSKHGVLPEDWGGDTIFVPVSAKKHIGIETLLETILLVSEMQELRANPNRSARGAIIEAKLDKGRGSVATVLVQKGTLKKGDVVLVGSAFGKIRAMFNSKGKKINAAGPSVPVEILGLSEVPLAGDSMVVMESEKDAKNIAEKRKNKMHQQNMNVSSKVSLEDLFERIQKGEVKDLNLIIKADVSGSIEVVKQSLQKESLDEVKVNPIHGGVGGINETDIMLASASNAIVIGFNVRPTISALELAKRENVDIRTYTVIYNVIEDIKAAVRGMLAPEYKEVVMGRAEVRATFKVPNIGIVAGVYVTNGKVTRKSKIRLLRNDTITYEGDITSLKRFKDDASELNTGYEGGVGIEKFNDIKEGDVIEAYIMEEIKR